MIGDSVGRLGIPAPAELVGEVEKPARPKHPTGDRVLGRRHAEEEAFQRCAEESAAAGELLAEDLRLAQEHLGDITGKFTSDDLLGEIFSSFCIGK